MISSTDNRLLAGIDIFVEAPFSALLPKQVGAMKLEHISSRGTKLKGSELEKRILDVNWLCARYVFDGSRPLTSETEASILQVIQTVGSQYKWSSVIKLYTLDGKPQYS
ncbi:MAG: hypothetical protein RI932_1683 [Pseudomonadota bacterium]|jgi:hypothetical protein